MRRRLLVADDSATIQKVIRIAFNRSSVELIEAASLIEALANVAGSRPDGIIIDASLPGTRSPDDFVRLRHEAGDVPVLLLVGSYDGVDEAVFRQAGFQKILKKPFESGDIVTAIDQLLGLQLTPPPPPPPNRQVTSQVPPVSQPPISFPPISIPPIKVATSVPPPPAVPMPPPPPMEAFDNVTFEPDLPDIQSLDEPSINLTSTDRARHATVIHAGGFPGLPPFEDGELPTELAPTEPFVPPIPQTHEGQKGRRAFGVAEIAPEMPQIPPLAPPSARPSAPMAPQRPADLSFDIGELDVGSTTDLADFGAMPEFKPASVAKPPLPPPPRASAAPVPPPAVKPPEAQQAEPQFGLGNEGTDSSTITQVPPTQMPTWIRQAVEDYCERHFKSLAREVLTAELRRLAEEKARHLVDN